MNGFWDNFLEIAIGVAILWFVIVQGVDWERFTSGSAKVANKVKIQ